MLAPEDSGGVAAHLGEQFIECIGAWPRLVGAPTQVAKLAEEAPLLGRADETELGDLVVKPIVRWLEMRPALKDHDIVRANSKAVSQLIADAVRNFLAPGLQDRGETSVFQFGERHVALECGEVGSSA